MKVYTLGGYNESGRNMSAVEVDDEIIIFDMGVQMNNLVQYNDEVNDMSVEELIEKEILPNPSMLFERKDKVKAIVISHAHLDHIGGVQYLAHFFNCPIYGTPFTIEMLKVLMKSSPMKVPLRNKFIKINTNSSFRLPSGTEVEFINVTHSTPQTAIVALHTSEGVLIYANDYRFDNRPMLGQKTNYDRLQEIQKNEGVKVAIIEAVRSNVKRKSLSEVVVKEMLRDIFIETDTVDTKGIVVTTFASHITRVNSIIELAYEVGRKPVLLGRSMAKYSKAARNTGLVDFKSKGVEIAETPREVSALLKRIQEYKEDYVIICTGHQGEPNAVLSRISEGKTPFHLEETDRVVFSSEVIPVEVNIVNRKVLEEKLSAYKCKIYRDIHVSGHAGREDHRDLLDMINPEMIIPTHGPRSLKEGLIQLAVEKGYEEGKSLLNVEDNKIYDIQKGKLIAVYDE